MLLLSKILIYILLGSILLLVVGMGIYRTVANFFAKTFTVPAQVATKRMKVRGGYGGLASRSEYYVTFQLSTGKRNEFRVNDTEYGMLAEGDDGTLVFRGSWFYDFRSQGVEL